jgi:hypothetical protein
MGRRWPARRRNVGDTPFVKLVTDPSSVGSLMSSCRDVLVTWRLGICVEDAFGVHPYRYLCGATFQPQFQPHGIVLEWAADPAFPVERGC